MASDIFKRIKGSNPLVAILATCLTVLCFYAFFYRTVVKRWGRFVQPLLDRSSLATRYPVRSVEAVGKLAAATVAQVLFALLLMMLTGTSPRSVTGSRFHVDLILLGAGVGLGELALSSLLCTTAVNLVLLATSDATTSRVSEWLVEGRGGWMSLFSATSRTAPTWLTVLILCLYVTVEEFIFRGILIEVLRGAGMAWAVAVSTALFVTVQSFNMPSARAAIFPMLGAFVVGVTHGILFWSVPDILPLMVAHLTFFAGTLGLWNREEPVIVTY